MFHLHRFQNEQRLAFVYLLSRSSQHGANIAGHGRAQRPLAFAALVRLWQWREPGEPCGNTIDLYPIAVVWRRDDNGAEIASIYRKTQVWDMLLQYCKGVGRLLAAVLKRTLKAAIPGGDEQRCQFLFVICAKAIREGNIGVVAPVAALAFLREILRQGGGQCG